MPAIGGIKEIYPKLRNRALPAGKESPPGGAGLSCRAAVTRFRSDQARVRLHRQRPSESHHARMGRARYSFAAFPLTVWPSSP
jgi:hypothetical protein